MNTYRTLLLSAALFLFTSCAPTFNVTMGTMPVHDPGAKIEAERADFKVESVTTRSEIVELFGQPDFKGVDADGLPQWTWTRLGVEVRGAKEAKVTSFFNLEVSFDGELVSSYSYSKKAD